MDFFSSPVMQVGYAVALAFATVLLVFAFLRAFYKLVRGRIPSGDLLGFFVFIVAVVFLITVCGLYAFPTLLNGQLWAQALQLSA